jgi:UDP-N-acetylglucosamine--N-acetylmuramyl-(pentapeptide) pyrophosphoryl-undecaprenol N-acetylglucosamine transferase
MKDLNLLIIGGGTGGHISPGIALYESFIEKGVNIFFLTGKSDRRFTYLSDIDSGRLFFYGPPPITKNIFKLPVFALRFLFAVFRASRIMQKKKITGVIGMGGYVSAPALIAARMKGISVYLCEQNSVPGKVTKFFSKKARVIYSTFAVTKDYLKDINDFVHAGNPIRKSVFAKATREDAKAFFNLRHCTKIILLIGGSQGALTLNELIVGLKKAYPDDFKQFGIIWSTGDYSYDKYKKMLQEEIITGSVFLSPFITSVGMAYIAADIAISRAGSGVMMELAAMGIPSILIPYPFAALDHQNMNADEFVRGGAAVKIMNDDATPEKVGPMMIDLLNNVPALNRMSEKARALAKKDAAGDIASHIITEQSA